MPVVLSKKINTVFVRFEDTICCTGSNSSKGKDNFRKSKNFIWKAPNTINCIFYQITKDIQEIARLLRLSLALYDLFCFIRRASTSTNATAMNRTPRTKSVEIPIKPYEGYTRKTRPGRTTKKRRPETKKPMTKSIISFFSLIVRFHHITAE